MKFVLLALSIFVAVSPLSGAEPSTPEQRQRLIEITHNFEKDAFGSDTSIDRSWAMTFIERSPDIVLKVNLDLIRELLLSRAPQKNVVFNQFLLGFASFSLEHPERSTDEATLYYMAFKSSLAVYRQAIKRDPANQVIVFDALEQKEREGTLRAYVERLLVERKPDLEKVL